MSTVYLLHGLPGTGKTTYARQLEKETGAVCLNHDEFMTTLFGHNPPAERFQEYHARIQELIWSLTGKLTARGLDVILDHGFWTRSSRDEARARVLSMNAIPRFYALNCARDVADARVLHRSKTAQPDSLSIDQPALDHFRSLYEPLGLDEEHVTIETSS